MIVDKNTETSYVLIEAVRTFARSHVPFVHLHMCIEGLELWCCVESYSKVPAALIIICCLFYCCFCLLLRIAYPAAAAAYPAIL